MRPKSELGNIGLADNDRTGTLDALDQDRISPRHEILEQRRTKRAADTRGRLQILNRDRKAMQRTAHFATCNFSIALLRLFAEQLPRLDGNDRVDGRVDTLNSIEERIHDLNTGN